MDATDMKLYFVIANGYLDEAYSTREAAEARCLPDLDVEIIESEVCNELYVRVKAIEVTDALDDFGLDKD
jgi:predicted adenine nucleotide alpha hydrolase (AANH) superfamily ATPase